MIIRLGMEVQNVFEDRLILEKFMKIFIKDS